MNERSQELIVDLIGGLLSPAEERAALARIENDPVLRTEYEMQKSAISVLGSSSMPSMTPQERSTLHAALRQQLHLEPSPTPVVTAPSRWQRWWAPLGGLAAAAVVVFGAVVVLPGVLSGGDSDGAIQLVSAEIGTTAPASSPADGLADQAADGSDDTGGTDAEAPEAPESALAGGSSADEEMQPTTTAASFDAAGAAADLPYLLEVDLQTLEDQLASNPESLRNSLSTPSTKSSDLDTSQLNACLDSLRANDSATSFSPLAATTYEGIEAVVVSASPAEGEPFLVVLAVESCRELTGTQR
ncbi:MAG: hypothetical protein U9R47_09365 [Actinomycetota bacterium]|nr:hypothetical protein [Actinomycetota bacterium]